MQEIDHNLKNDQHLEDIVFFCAFLSILKQHIEHVFLKFFVVFGSSASLFGDSLLDTLPLALDSSKGNFRTRIHLPSNVCLKEQLHCFFKARLQRISYRICYGALLLRVYIERDSFTDVKSNETCFVSKHGMKSLENDVKHDQH